MSDVLYVTKWRWALANMSPYEMRSIEESCFSLGIVIFMEFNIVILYF